MKSVPSNRVLVVDDTPSIHDDFREILVARDRADLGALGELFKGDPEPSSRPIRFEIDSAFQGDEGLSMVERAVAEGQPYSLCFLDVRMPPGWSGPETLQHLWRVDPDLQVVLCTAYADFSWHELLEHFERTDRLLILKKPFEVPEVRQLAHALSEKWRLAREIRLRMAELEERVAERTQELEDANEHLRREMHQRARAQNELSKRRRVEALGRLAAGIGHEINNPLAFVAGNIENSMDTLSEVGRHLPDEPRKDLQDFLGDALVGTDRIAHIVRSIHRFVRPGEEVATPVDIKAAVELALSMVDKDRGGHIKISTDLADVPRVLGRAFELDQVFINLLGNAIHAISSNSPGDAEIRVTTRLEGRDQVVVEIADTGIGIDEDDLDKIFEPFFTTKPVGKGTGLGLSVCLAIVDSMGGGIDVRPGDERGTVVTVRLPAVVISSADSLPGSTGESTAGRDGDRVAGRLAQGSGEHVPIPVGGLSQEAARVLVVDDEPLIRKLIQRVLHQHHVVGAGSGREGLARCLEQDFDVIFCDLMMPEVTGMDLYRTLEQSRPEMVDKIIFITGGALLDDVRGFLATVPNRCFDKPVANDLLRAIVAERLEQSEKSKARSGSS